jgi:hypothetical protein
VGRLHGKQMIEHNPNPQLNRKRDHLLNHLPRRRCPALP